jgi:glycine/D-amino acid oxidase-like deaminating enzyme
VCLPCWSSIAPIRGHTKAASYRAFLNHAEEHGIDTAVKIAQLELDNIRALYSFVLQRSIACDSNPCDTIDVIYDPTQWKYGQIAVQAMRDAMPGHPVSRYAIQTGGEVRERWYCGKGGNEPVCGGIVYEAGSIDSHKFTIGVLKLCLDLGMNLQTNTAAINLVKQDQGHWRIQTNIGHIVTRKVVLATNR